jgi:hypothetical protein
MSTRPNKYGKISVFAREVGFQQKSQKIFQILCEARVSVLYLNSRCPTFLGLCPTGGAQPGPIAIFIHEAGAMSAYECIADVKTGWT